MQRLDGLINLQEFEIVETELYLAGIPMKVNTEDTRFSTVMGQLGDWKFIRGNYWMASAPAGEGLPLNAARELSNKNYPIINSDLRSVGLVARFLIKSKDTDPTHEGAGHYDSEGRQLLLDPDGEQERLFATNFHFQEIAKLYHFVKDQETFDQLTAKSTVDTYHIDNQVGLNELARVIRESQ
ncbi:hypothetical protein HN832_02755 [archaeon]|jgi:hypothetical protein|nr:hypothetical protein [archaeon]MBT4373275.1 hypothetical protein [archaeon]MBT4531620.1 hypothetical protein [archaeon]MBT7001202.1 hypothetical protein [archaeon]MBT7282312.1 hypothetical protein [archaeon]